MKLNRKFLFTSMCVLALFTLLYFYIDIQRPPEGKLLSASTKQLIEILPTVQLRGRELDNQFLIHNVSIFSENKNKELITSAFIGTSRSKMLRPSWMEGFTSVNASGNSYNEITYGILLQAELLRVQFPNIKTIFIETSFLLRRPDQIVLEEDHKKYASILSDIWPLRDKIDHLKKIDFKRKNFSVLDEAKLIMSERRKLQIRNMLVHLMNSEDIKSYSTKDLRFAQQLNANGERTTTPQLYREKKDQLPSITENHIKVQRLRDIESWFHWDGLFEIVGLWGQEHSIQIIFYEPAVRSDLYQFQLKYGIEKHRSDILDVSSKYNIPYINLNTPDTGFHNQWELFSDEDHLETCLGVAYYQAALEIGYRDFKEHKSLYRSFTMDELKSKAKHSIQRHCN